MIIKNNSVTTTIYVAVAETLSEIGDMKEVPPNGSVEFLGTSVPAHTILCTRYGCFDVATNAILKTFHHNKLFVPVGNTVLIVCILDI